MAVIRFTIPGEPVAKQRPRVYRTSSGKSVAVTPTKTVNYENLVKWVLTNSSNTKMLEGEIEASIKAMFSIPKSMSKKDRRLVNEGKLRPTKKPDVDNVAKIILDSINGLAYKDDSQVTKLTIEKEYSENPRVEVVLRER